MDYNVEQFFFKCMKTYVTGYINHQWKYWEIDICIIASTIMFLMNIFEDIQITEISVNIYSQ